MTLDTQIGTFCGLFMASFVRIYKFNALLFSKEDSFLFF